jgi:hypothetical protein
VGQVNHSHSFRGLGCFPLGAFVVAVALGATTPARSQDQDSALRSIAKQTGLATDVNPPADFVLKSRPAEPPAPMPVFGTPDEPPSKVLTPSQLKAMDADLDTAGKKHDVLRAGFAPSAKAVAEAKAEAAEKAKRRKKPTDAASKPAP